MKKIYAVVFVFLILIFSSNAFAQVAKNSWGFGFGATYPRIIEFGQPGIPGYFGTSPMEDGVGGYLTIQRNMTEHVSARLMGYFHHLSYEYQENTIEFWGTQYGNTNVIGGNVDLLYYFVPCEKITPYLAIGAGGFYYMQDNPPDESVEDDLDYRISLGFGAEWDINENWAVTTELAYQTWANSNISGATGSTGGGGLLGGSNSTYMNFNLGLMYTFSKGEPSRICDLYDGLVADVPEIDYERIENIVKKHIPEVIEKEVYVEKPAEAAKWVLVGVNFDFNKATLRPEAYPILFNAVQVLQNNPDMKVEIQGHTDGIGSEEYNMKLGQRRAQTVHDYLVSRGVDSSRLTTKSYGESQPVADNNTAAGRQINRRVEFKVLSD